MDYGRFNITKSDFQTLIVLLNFKFSTYKQWRTKFDILCTADLKDIPKKFAGRVKGQSIALTGWIPVSRRDLIQVIKKCGGKIITEVNEQCQLLMCGERPGMKLFEANELGVPILFYIEIGKMLKVYD